MSSVREFKKMSKSDKNTRHSENEKDKKKTQRKKKMDSDSESSSGEEEEEDELEWETESDDSSYHPPEKNKSSYQIQKNKLKTRSTYSKKHVQESDDEDENTDDEQVKKFIKRIKAKQQLELETKKSNKSKSKKNKKVEVLDESESEDDSEDDSEEEDDDEDDEEEEEEKKNVYIVFGGGGGAGGEESMYETYEDVENAEIEQALEDDNDECNSEDEKTFMKEDYQEIDCSAFTKDKHTKNIKNSKHNSKHKKSSTDVEEETKKPSVEEEYKELIDIRRILSDQLKKNPNSKMCLSTLKTCSDSIRKLVKNTRTKNAKDYHKLTKTEMKNATAEIDYFKKKLSHKEQKAIMNELKIINEHIHIDKPYRLALLQTKLPIKYKATVMQKLNIMKSMEQGDSEYHKMKTWVDTFMRVPFNVYKNLSVNMNDGMDVCDQFMKNAKGHLDDCVYGLDDAKLQILQMMGQWITNPDAMGSAIAIHGPPGTGKTSLSKEGISKILGREFAFISLGGAGDASFLEGHSYTYEGSLWGKIVQILIDSKCMNPVIYFDELDKLSDSARGQEITGILTHLIDKSQNSQFHDKYFSEVDFDLSKCLFIFSYNDENAVNPILRDRMYRIKTKGYDCAEKVVIAKKYMLPKIREQVNFKEGDIIISDEVLQYLISTPRFTQKEEGVRNLNRCLEIIHTKLNLFRLMRSSGTETDNIPILGKNADIKVSFPYTVTKKDVDILIHNEENQNQSLLAMYI